MHSSCYYTYTHESVVPVSSSSLLETSSEASRLHEAYGLSFIDTHLVCNMQQATVAVATDGPL